MSGDPNPKPISAKHKDSRPPGELTRKCIGTGVYARTCLGSKKLNTTTKKGPCVSDVHIRTLRDATTGHIIHDCIVEDTPDGVLHRRLGRPRDIRAELTINKAQLMFEVEGADIAEIYSPLRTVEKQRCKATMGYN